MEELLTSIPAKEGLRNVAAGAGDSFDLGAIHFRWKARSDDSAGSYTVFELILAPGEGVDLHSHASPETFYILEGEATFYRVMNGKQEALACATGTTVLIPPNALHALFNETKGACRLLDISTPQHQRFFDSLLAANQQQPFEAQSSAMANKRMAKIATDNDMYLAPYDVRKRQASLFDVSGEESR